MAPVAPPWRPPLAAGLFVEAEILGREEASVHVLPRSALRASSQTLIVDAEDRLRWREVQVLRADREHVVVGAGLAAGDRVCVSALESVVDGMQVRVRDSAPTLGAREPHEPGGSEPADDPA